VTGRMLLAALVTAGAAAAGTAVLCPPTRPLAGRVRPYTTAERVRLGAPPGRPPRPGGRGAAGLVPHVLSHAVGRLAETLARLADPRADAALLLRLRHAGLLQDVAEHERAHAYRVRQLAATGGWAAGATVALVAVGAGLGTALLVGVLAGLHGATRWGARVARSIEDRRLRMRIELYTVNQLLALHVRAGGGVVQAVTRVVERGRGPVVTELAEVLRAHRTGRGLGDALETAARTSAEPNAARTYRLLASGAEHGADLAEGLRALSQDIRGQRAEALKRAATKRRAAMLLPIIAILAPVMLLFIGAPLPSIVFGSW
jgi:tight adherence protein C